jgi:hypothetical protein
MGLRDQLALVAMTCGLGLVLVGSVATYLSRRRR